MGEGERERGGDREREREQDRDRGREIEHGIAPIPVNCLSAINLMKHDIIFINDCVSPKAIGFHLSLKSPGVLLSYELTLNQFFSFPKGERKCCSKSEEPGPHSSGWSQGSGRRGLKVLCY